MNKRKGQSIIEAVIMIGVLAMVMTGAVVLLLNSISSRTRGFDRKKAIELGETVIEDLVDSKNNNPAEFWKLTDVPISENKSKAGYEGYTYMITFVPTVLCAGCSEAVVSVMWNRDVGYSTVNTRLFSYQ